MKKARFTVGDDDSVKTGHVEGERLYVEGTEYSFEEVTFLPPCRPTKIVCIGLNYRDHADESGLPVPENPLIFLKPCSALIGHRDAIRFPAQSSRVDFEGELALVIGRRCSAVGTDTAFDYIGGYTILNDVTARDIQLLESKMTRAKGFDTFAPCGPWIVESLDPSNLKIETLLNGELRQNSSTAELIFSIPTIISFVSNVMTLEPGDIVATGTPAGVGPMQVGDVVEVRIEGIGSLTNIVR